MRKLSLCSLFVFGCFLAVLGGDAKCKKDEPPDLSLINRDVKTIKNGFVFIKGRYIPPPYRLYFKDGIFYINAISTVPLGMWPIKGDSYKKPVVPERLLKSAKSIDDDEFALIWGKMQTWAREMYGSVDGEEYRRVMKEFFEQFDFIDKVVITRPKDWGDNPAEIFILKNGKKEENWCGLIKPFRTTNDILRWLEKWRTDYEDILLEDGVLYFFPKEGVRTSAPMCKDTLEEFCLLRDVLRSDWPEKKKLSFLTKERLFGAIPRSVLLKNFKLTKEFEERLNALCAKLGVEPMTVEKFYKRREEEERRLTVLKRRGAEIERRFREEARQRRLKRERGEPVEDDDVDVTLDGDGNVVDFDENGNIYIVEPADKKEDDEEEE